MKEGAIQQVGAMKVGGGSSAGSRDEGGRK